MKFAKEHPFIMGLVVGFFGGLAFVHWVLPLILGG